MGESEAQRRFRSKLKFQIMPWLMFSPDTNYSFCHGVDNQPRRQQAMKDVFCSLTTMQIRFTQRAQSFYAEIAKYDQAIVEASSQDHIVTTSL